MVSFSCIIIRFLLPGVLLSVLLVSAAKDRGKRRKRTDAVVDPSVSVSDEYLSRSLEDWTALSRDALSLIANQYSIVATGSRAVLASRLHQHFQSRRPSSTVANTHPVTSDVDNVSAVAGPSAISSPALWTADLNAFREDVVTLIGDQLQQGIAAIRNELRNNHQPSDAANIHSPSPCAASTYLQTLLPPQVTASSNNHALADIVDDTFINPVSTINGYRFPSIPSTTIALIKAGKFVNFDLLLPAPTSLPNAAFSVQVDPLASTDGGPSLTVLPKVNKRTIRNFPSWLSAWNVFIQAFLFFFPGFAGGLLAYQSQITIFASRFEFLSWSTYDRLFRQNMATFHPNSNWGEVDRHIFDQVLLGAPVLTVCYTCREFGHVAAGCPLRSSSTQQPFPAPQRTFSSNPRARPPPMSTRSSSRICRYFNAGSCTVPLCIFQHTCSTCQGPHPATKCKSHQP